MRGIFMVAMMGFQYERDGPGTKHQPVGCSQNTTGQVPKLCRGGENRSGEYAIVENCCAELESCCSMHVLMPLMMLALHHHHPPSQSCYPQAPCHGSLCVPITLQNCASPSLLEFVMTLISQKQNVCLHLNTF